MFLISFEYHGEQAWGAIKPDERIIYPANDLFEEKVPATLLEFIKQEKPIHIQPYTFPERGISLEQVKLLAPIPKPVRNIFCVGKNYLDHIIEFAKQDHSAQKPLEHPAFFTKATNTVIGAFDAIPSHSPITNQVDYEAELAVIIGKKGVDIPEEKAMDYVFGYTILNDVTARDLQKRHLQWVKGKSLDGFCPMGPWIVTRDEIPEPVELNISSQVNGEIRQMSNTRQMIFNIPALISVLSQGMTLEPGDILATGTPSGVGMGFEPPKFLRKGDVVRVEIEKIGYMENTVS
ncbi:MAG: fumarylacetoacetate hydrolase family protein [Caldicoprobacterales bacterium]|jgi:2-keto-4-pentenoate hydratase/2-oxohepta-3-ene-1,7-dioic acid hydratase in catechol pathway|nr:fumarylacetoacetate hydrolase family protein [Clostridiales bacterium]